MNKVIEHLCNIAYCNNVGSEYIPEQQLQREEGYRRISDFSERIPDSLNEEDRETILENLGNFVLQVEQFSFAKGLEYAIMLLEREVSYD